MIIIIILFFYFFFLVAQNQHNIPVNWTLGQYTVLETQENEGIWHQTNRGVKNTTGPLFLGPSVEVKVKDLITTYRTPLSLSLPHPLLHFSSLCCRYTYPYYSFCMPSTLIEGIYTSSSLSLEHSPLVSSQLIASMPVCSSL